MKKTWIMLVVIILILIGLRVIFSLSPLGRDAKAITGEAVAKNDLSICEKVPPPLGPTGYTKDNCYYQVARVNKNITACNYYHGGGDDFCFSTVAGTAGDISICDKVKDAYQKGHCYGGFVEASNDLSICKPLTNSTAIDACYIHFAEVGKVGADFCDKNFNTLTNYKNSCYTIAARNKRDVKICDKIQGQYAERERSECIRYIQDTEYRYKNN